MHGQGGIRFSLRRKRDLRVSACNYERIMIVEESSRAKKKSESMEKSGNGGMEGQENKHVAIVIRKLDKETLNLYTPLRAGLGAREPSWIGLVSNGLRPEHRIEWMEDRQS